MRIHKITKGFTLLEMMVVLAIVSVIMAVVLFGYSAFSQNLSLSSAIQEMSVAIRQAQTYGLSVKESTVGASKFSAGYGLYFTTTDPSNYYIFTDVNNDQKYDGGANCASSGDCLVEKVTLRNRVTITGLCGVVFGATTLVCPPGANVVGMTVVFLRPNPEAAIRFINNDNTFYGGTFQTGKITVSSQQGRTSFITIENTGQVSVQQ